MSHLHEKAAAAGQEAYEQVVRGKLKLKGGLGKKRKKKKKSKQAKKEHAGEEDGKSKSAQEQQHQQQDADLEDEEMLTESEKQYLEVQWAREAELIEKKIAKSHRARIEEFNEYLGSLSEHHDLPKVGPG